MLALIVGVLWAGFTFEEWGRYRVRACTNDVSLSDLVLPGRVVAGPIACAHNSGNKGNGSSSNPDVPGAPPANAIGNNPGTTATPTRPQSPPSTEDYFGR